MSGPRYTHPAQALAEIAHDNMQDDLNALIRAYVTEQVGDGWTGDVDPPLSASWDQTFVGVLRQLIENGMRPTRIRADAIETGVLIDLDDDGVPGGEPFGEPRRVEAVAISPSGDVEVSFEDDQPPAMFKPDEELWRIDFGEPREEPGAVWLSPQARALLAGLLDPDVQRKQAETGDGQVFAPDEVWAEVKTALPPDVYRQALNEEGQIE